VNGRILAPLAALYALLAVVLAALGAHLLQTQAEASQKLWETALQMHMFHAAALLGVAALAHIRNSILIDISGLIIAAGALLFCGSLYLRSSGFDFLPGPITPAGGLMIMLGWAVLILTLVRKN
jgi:uncharacterized membrane protein YgdD (TMEM256/DUF423 family)